MCCSIPSPLPLPRQLQAGLFSVPGIKASKRPPLWKGKCEASKEMETRQRRLLPVRRQTPIVHREGLEKAASVHAAFVFRMTKAPFTLHAYLCHLLTLNLCPPSCPLLFCALHHAESAIFQSRFSLYSFSPRQPQRPYLQPLALSTPAVFLFVLSRDLSQPSPPPSGGRLR